MHRYVFLLSKYERKKKRREGVIGPMSQSVTLSEGKEKKKGGALFPFY